MAYPAPQNPIHIKKSHKGLFTAKAKKHGMSVQQYASYVLANKGQLDSATIKQAQFARSATKFGN